MNKKLSGFNLGVMIAMLASVVGLIIFFITSTTGYLASSSVDYRPIICTVAAILLMILYLVRKKAGILGDLFMYVAEGFLLYAFAVFVLARIPLAADVHFIPVNYPATEEFALNCSIVGVVFYVIAIVSMIVVGFQKKRQ